MRGAVWHVVLVTVASYIPLPCAEAQDLRVKPGGIGCENLEWLTVLPRCGSVITEYGRYFLLRRAARFWWWRLGRAPLQPPCLLMGLECLCVAASGPWVHGLAGMPRWVSGRELVGLRSAMVCWPFSWVDGRGVSPARVPSGRHLFERPAFPASPAPEAGWWSERLSPAGRWLVRPVVARPSAWWRHCSGWLSIGPWVGFAAVCSSAVAEFAVGGGVVRPHPDVGSRGFTPASVLWPTVLKGCLERVCYGGFWILPVADLLMGPVTGVRVSFGSGRALPKVCSDFKYPWTSCHPCAR